MQKTAKYVIWTVAISSSLMLGACASTTNENTLGGNRKQFIMLPEQQYHAQAAQDYGSLIQQVRASGQLKSNAQVTRVSQRLLQQVPIYRADAAQWNWQVNVIESKDINAFAMPGGKIAVFTGLLNAVKPTDDELAAVLAHEIAHALREHSREKASKSAVGGLVTSLITSYAGLSNTGNEVVSLASKYGWDLPNSRSAETEADLIGLEMMARAGYNPNAAITFWQKMAAANLQSGQSVSFLSTHPASADRIAKIQQTIPQVMPYYQAAKR
ncbi:MULTISPECIES: M48 family metallopeptidase [Vitreoscilla]|uniref:M48 family metallopeptidase n=1 Tax=Vitreoscilla stercoraria TaxID=61 RepID=A0ABY4E8U9_VITST|nr:MULTISPECIES: M48 family metallopeptidase [Vitreoscilla]AUZ04602.2 peptidase M48 [Vitreoscilla sp. C1]UOO91699.1 M48 family metallopeptidase [Vitreoscilla stercoraria]